VRKNAGFVSFSSIAFQVGTEACELLHAPCSAGAASGKDSNKE
jgi:hypothetical protein